MWKHLYHIWYNITAACICKRLYWRKQQYKWQQNNNKYGNNQEILVSASLWLALYRKQALKEGTKNAPKAKLPMYKVGLQNCCKNITWTILQDWKKHKCDTDKSEFRNSNGFHNTLAAIIPKCSKKYKSCPTTLLEPGSQKTTQNAKNVVHKKSGVHNTLGAMVVVALCRSV